MSDRIDKTVPGGRYVGADGVVRDANGKVLKDEDGFPLETRGNDEPEPPTVVPAETPEPEQVPEPTPEPKPARKRKAA